MNTPPIASATATATSGASATRWAEGWNRARGARGAAGRAAGNEGGMAAQPSRGVDERLGAPAARCGLPGDPDVLPVHAVHRERPAALAAVLHRRELGGR